MIRKIASLLLTGRSSFGRKVSKTPKKFQHLRDNLGRYGTVAGGTFGYMMSGKTLGHASSEAKAYHGTQRFEQMFGAGGKGFGPLAYLPLMSAGAAGLGIAGSIFGRGMATRSMKALGQAVPPRAKRAMPKLLKSVAPYGAIFGAGAGVAMTTKTQRIAEGRISSMGYATDTFQGTSKFGSYFRTRSR